MRSDAVPRLTAAQICAWRERARACGQRCVTVTCAPQDDVHAVMVRLGQSLSFPCYYGANLDALYDCLTDFELPEQGTSLMVLIEDLPVGAHLSARQLVALRKVLRDARADWAARGKDLAVAYSVRLAAT